MKRSKTQLPKKANFRTFLPLIALNLGSSSVEGLRVTKNVKAIKFEAVLGELESKKGFQRQ